jgi:hypothetical protein
MDPNDLLSLEKKKKIIYFGHAVEGTRSLY